MNLLAAVIELTFFTVELIGRPHFLGCACRELAL